MEFEENRATLLDLSMLAEQASSALDNASAPLPRLLMRAAWDLEFAYFTTGREEHFEKAKQILSPVLTAMGLPPEALGESLAE